MTIPEETKDILERSYLWIALLRLVTPVTSGTKRNIHKQVFYRTLHLSVTGIDSQKKEEKKSQIQLDIKHYI